MSVRATIEYTGAPAELMRDAEQALRAGLAEGAKEWDRTYKPLHFAESAGGRYGYAKRAGEGETSMVYTGDRTGRLVVAKGRALRLKKNRRYYWQKWWKFKHHRPLVYSGASEAAAASGVISTRRAGGDFEGRASYQMPKYFVLSPVGSAVDKVKEFTTATREEEIALAAVVDRAADERMARVSKRKTSVRKR